jgi:Tol biopolymer transport system component
MAGARSLTGPLNMGISEVKIPCIAVAACVLGLVNAETLARSLGRSTAAQAAPAGAGQQAALEPDRRLPERFMVIDHGCALLGPDGEEKERLESITSAVGAISPDGRWAAFSKSDLNLQTGKEKGGLIIQSRVRPDERTTVPLVWGTTGSSFQPFWSSDSKRMLICEQGQNEDGSRGSAYRVFDLMTKSLTHLKLSKECWPSDWSADGKRVLTSLRMGGDGTGVAWVNTDGTGKPEFITSQDEVAYGAKLSPDGRRILCMAGPKTPAGEPKRRRLVVIDLNTKKRTVIDRPGHTHGYCWSSDGLKVAHTWQLPLRQPGEIEERKTYLITCDADGGNRKTITTRKYEVPTNSSGRDGVTIFFEVVAWWR